MKKELIKHWVDLLLIPALVVIFGLVLLAMPDSASILISRILGWILILLGAGTMISLAGRSPAPVGRWIIAACGVILGIYILKNPLLLAQAAGRCTGLLLILLGVREIRQSPRKSMVSLCLSVAVALVGLLLVLLPLTLTRTIFRLCGLVAVVIGVAVILKKLEEQKRLERGKDSIIDADP